MREDLGNPATTPERLKHLRRALAGLAQPETMAFITPAGSRIDGDMAEWAGTDPIVISNRADYVPLSEGATWGGVEQLSAKIYTGWNQEGLTIAIDVADSSPASPRPGSETTTGDRVRIVIDARETESGALDPNDCFVGTIALVNGTSYFSQDSGPVPESGLRPEGKSRPAVSGKGRQYELFVPWTVPA